MIKKLIIAILALLVSLVCVCGLGGCFGGDRYERDGQGVGYAEYDGKYYVGDYDRITPSEVIIPSTFNGKSVVGISDCAFNGSNVSAITIPASITSIGDNVFGDCNYLEKITVSGDNKYYHSSGNCLILTADKVLISGCKDSIIPADGSVTAIGNYAFYNLTSLKSLEIPDSVLQIGYEAFNYCSGLENITIGSGVTKIDTYAFGNCISLTSLILPETVTVLGERVFDGCRALVIYCKAESKPDGWDYEWRDVLFTHFIPHMKAPVVWGCENNEVADDGYIYKFSDGVRYALKDGSARVFRQPANIEKAVISPAVSYKNNDYTVTAICDQAFCNCNALTVLEITDGIISIGDEAFYGCKNLESISVPDSATSMGDSVFAYCSALINVTLPNGLTKITENMFIGCSGLANITIPDSVTSIGKSAFSNCRKLTNIVIPQGVTTIRELTFYECGKLTSITLPDSVTVIGKDAFNACVSLEKVTLPDSLTGISSFAFYRCTALKEIIIPKSVTAIKNNAFASCFNLTIYCEAESKPEDWSEDWNIIVIYAESSEYCNVVWNYKKDN